MPRISKKNKAELLEALYKSDSDDDDDLLMSSVHLQPSQRSPDSSIDDDMPLKVSIELPAKSSTKPSAPVETKEKFEERGKKQNGKKCGKQVEGILLNLAIIDRPRDNSRTYRT